MGMSNETTPTYVTKKQGERLDAHENRITRLERVVLIVVGYMIAEGSKLLADVATILL